LWGILVLLSCGLIIALASVEGELRAYTPLDWSSLLLGLAPLVAAQLTLGSPWAARQVQDWLRQVRWPLLHTAGGLSALYLISGLLTGGFDPYATVIFIAGSFTALGALRQIQRGHSGLTWVDLAVWLLLWIPFDLRWNYDLWFGIRQFAYTWWSVALTVLAVIGWGVLRELPDFGYRLVPRWRDLGIALLATAVFAAIVIPIGLAIDFLTFPPTTPFQIGAVVAQFIGLFLTVALPEELFFRGILLHGLDQLAQRPGWNLLITSLAFGLMHWNNAGDLVTKIAYCALATLAGLFYGWAYRKSGNNLLAPVVTHTLVDLIWRFVFQ
jgi:membrane protease YdiL (CAAX protease family)